MKGKQTEEERKQKKRSYKMTKEAAERAMAAKKLKRLHDRQTKANEKLDSAKEDLLNLGLCTDITDKRLKRLLESPMEDKIEFKSID